MVQSPQLTDENLGEELLSEECGGDYSLNLEQKLGFINQKECFT